MLGHLLTMFKYSISGSKGAGKTTFGDSVVLQYIYHTDRKCRYLNCLAGVKNTFSPTGNLPNFQTSVLYLLLCISSQSQIGQHLNANVHETEINLEKPILKPGSYPDFFKHDSLTVRAVLWDLPVDSNSIQYYTIYHTL
jgi:hypothetical protein